MLSNICFLFQVPTNLQFFLIRFVSLLLTKLNITTLLLIFANYRPMFINGSWKYLVNLNHIYSYCNV